jgi:methylmalonyl-CoA mutase
MDFFANSFQLLVSWAAFEMPSQLEKINMLDYADVVAINKFDKAGALDALHDVRKQFKRNHQLWTAKDEELPIVGTITAH